VVPCLMSLIAGSFCSAQETARLSPEARKFVRVADPVVALTHARVIDGTGVPPVDDQTVLIEHGRITAMRSSAKSSVPTGARVIDLSGFTVIPGLVGMHEHMFYPSGDPRPRAEARCGITSWVLAPHVSIWLAGLRPFARQAPWSLMPTSLSKSGLTKDCW
jgi:N-acyl-D-aspartate/D-glutamate deacylase